MHRLLLILLFLPAGLWAQRGVGFRVGTDFRDFADVTDKPVLAQSTWSTFYVGGYYSSMSQWGGMRLGLNFIYKGSEDGGLRLPLLMQDFSTDQQTEWFSFEGDLRVGPRFRWFHPQTGILLGWVPSRKGFINGAEGTMQAWYAAVPIGASFDFPARWGTVGFGVFYTIGLNEMLRNSAGQNIKGSGVNALRVELHLTLQQ